jgi:TP901 family phage tail tape measure protein
MAGFPDITIQLKIDPVVNAQKLNAVLDALSKSMGDLGKDIKPIDEEQLTEAFKKIEDQAKQTGTDVKTSFEQGNAGADKFGQGMDAVKGKLKDVDDQAKKAGTDINTSFSKGNEGVDKFGKGVETVQEKLKGTGDLATKAFNFAMMSQSLSAAGQSMQSLSSQYVALDTGLRNVGTLGVTNWKDFNDLMQEYIHKGEDANIVTKSLYDAISAGTVKSTGGIGDLAGATAFLTASEKLAKAGLVDMTVTTDGLTTLLNAYGESADKAGKYSDILFGAVKLGKTTVAELTPELYNVVPIAKSAGISFEQVAAGLATITKAGVPTAEATTELRQMIAEMLRPTGNLALMMSKLGISVESIKAEGLQKTLVKLNDEMQRTGTLATNVFSDVYSANAFNALQMVDDTGAKVALQDLEYIQTKAIGSVDNAYSLASESIASKSKRMFGAIQGAITQAFSFVAPSMISLMNVMPQISSSLTALMALKMLDPVGTFKKLFISSGDSVSMIAKLGTSIKGLGASFGSVLSSAGTFARNLLSAVIPSLATTATAEAATGAAATTMWDAIGGPITLIVGGIAAVTAALFGMSALMSSLNKKSAEELLKEVETESQANASKLQIANEQVKIENDKQTKLKALHQEYQTLQTAVTDENFGGSEAQKNSILDRQKQILGEINQMYPGLIQKGDDYAKINEKLADADVKQEKAIIVKKSVAYETEVTQVKIDTRKADLAVEKVGEDLTKKMKGATQGWLDKAGEWLTGSSSAEQNAINAMDQYKQAIYKSTDDDTIRSNIINFQSAIWTDPAFKEVPEETKLEMVKSIEDMGTKQKEAVKKGQEMVKMQGGKLEDYLPKPQMESSGWLSDITGGIMNVFQPVFGIFSQVGSAAKDVWNVFKGLMIVVGDLVASFLKMVGNYVWGVITSIFTGIYNTIKSVGQYIGGVFTGIWNGLTSAFQTATTWVANLANQFPFLNTVMTSVKSVIDGVWSGIQNVIKTAQSAWNFFKGVGANSDKKAPIAATDQDVENAQKYDKLHKEQEYQAAVAAQQVKIYEALKQKLTEVQANWSQMSIFDQKQFEVAFKKQLKMATGLTADQRLELGKLLEQLYKSGGSLRGAKEQADKDYNGWEAIQQEVERKREELIRKNIKDEELAELQALQDKNNDKLKEYSKKISDYEQKLSASKSQKEKDSLQKSITYTKELMKLEGDEYNVDLQALYSKMADKRIKAITDLTKTEIDALKQRKEAINNYLKTGASVDISLITELQDVETKLLKQTSEQQINDIIQKSDGYKQLIQNIVQYETTLKQLQESSNNRVPFGIDFNKINVEKAEAQLQQAKKALQDYINNQKSSNEQIKLLQATLNAQLDSLHKQNDFELRDRQIKSMQDAYNQEYEFAKLTAEKEYNDQMSKSQGLISEQLKAWIDFQNKKSQIEIDRLNKLHPYYQSLYDFADNISKAFAEMKVDTNDNSTQETDNKLKEQQKSLEDNLKSQKLSYTDFTNQMNDLDKQRKDQVINNNKEIINAINNALKEAFQKTLDTAKTALQDSIKQYSNYSLAIKGYKEEEDKIDKEFASKSLDEQVVLYDQLMDLNKQKAEAEKKQQEELQQAYIQSGMIMGATFSKMIADGKSAQKAFVMSALEGAKAMVPVMVVTILGEEFAKSGLLGVATTAVMSGLLYAALSAAEAAVNRAKFYKGVVNLQGAGTYTSDSIPAKLSRGESVIPASATRKNIKELNYLLNNDTSVLNYYKEKEPQAIKQAFMEIATAKDFLNFVPVINLMLEERKMSNGEINTLRKELQTMNGKLDLLTEINQSIERGNYSRKTNTTIDLNVEVSDKELIKRIQRQELMSVRRS